MSELVTGSKALNEVAVFLERLPNKKSIKWLSGLVKVLTRIFYNYVSKLDKDRHLIFMNYGYLGSDLCDVHPALDIGDEDHRYQIQMYYHIASPISSWKGMHVLEVGSGRGGGASFIKRYFKPASMIGVDLSEEAVAFCNQYHASVDGLRFIQGDAESLQFPDESFDIILNVESSLYYPDVENFFNQVVRLLKPGGHFLYADMRFHDELETWHRQLSDTGLELLSQEDITQNVRNALALNQEFRQNLVRKYVPSLLYSIFSRFGGADGGRLGPNSHTPGKRVYKKFVFRKSYRT